MIALSCYKLANYLTDLNFEPDIKWTDVETMAFFQKPVSRNNCFYSLDEKGKHNYFLKQSRSLTQTNLFDVRSEAQLYLFAKGPLSSNIKSLIPAYVQYDDYNGVIVTKYLPSLRPLEKLASNYYFDAGRSLRTFHDTCSKEVVEDLFPKNMRDEDRLAKSRHQRFWIDDFREYEPFILRLTSVDRRNLASRNNPYVHQLLAFLNDNTEKIAEWRREWNKETKSLIHGDAAVRNFGMDDELIKIIDFEYVSYGAWFWDIAVFMASLLIGSTIPVIDPPRSGNPPDDVYGKIVKFCCGYGIDKAQQLIVIRWTGIYFLQLFMHSEEYFHLQFGLTLILKDQPCHDQIFIV